MNVNNFQTLGHNRRLKLAYVVVYLIFSLILFRLWYLQCLHGNQFRDRSENNRTRVLKTSAARGSIFDREGRLLVGNRPAFNLAIMREDTPNIKQTIKEISEIIGTPAADLQKRIDAKKTPPFKPQVVVPDISREMLARIKANIYKLPGVIIEVNPVRNYPYGEMASHIFGYVREISKKELNSKPDVYERGDSVGKSGIEKIEEDVLRGKNGFVRVEVDAGGRRRKELAIQEYFPGNDIFLTLDLDLQLAAEKAFGDRRGALVAMDPKSGDILALASKPSYDSNIFSAGMDSSVWKSLTKDSDKPLNNRATSSSYPPGSTFKLLSAVAGLNEKIITPETLVNCPGYYKFGRRRYRCHKRSGHGIVNLRSAIRQSCNVYFYELGILLGIDKLSEYGALFGLGKLTGIDLPGEKTGILASRKWKKKRLGEKWWPGDTVPVTIGQGYLSLTPLQLASSISILATDGIQYQPRLVSKVKYSDSKEIEKKSINIISDIKDKIPSKYFKEIRELSTDVVNHKKGTGQKAKLEAPIVGGKTGTAQVSRLSTAKKNKDNEALKDHAWFVSYAPAEDPMIVLAIVVENAGHGGVEAAPISKVVMEKFFQKKGMLVMPDEEKKDKKKGQAVSTPREATQ